MKVKSVNRGEARLVDWRGKKVRTGIFKYPVEGAIFLGTEDVVDDDVVDRKYHGGVDKAVYAYSANHYPFWKAQFPKLDWSLGMFGENLTIEGLDESNMLVGSRYKVGEAEVEVCQPRQPCFKLGVRFGTQSILKKFVNSAYPGVYFRVIKPGEVQIGDQLLLVREESGSPSIAEIYLLMYTKQNGADELIQKAINCKFLPEVIRATISKTQS
jgi:MOSC domain-containing protein YiiM